MTTKVKTLITTLLFTLTLYTTQASIDMGQLTTTIVDSELQTLPIAGAIVELTKQGDTTGSLYYSTDGDGALAIPMMRYGDYSIIISFMGYETQTIDFTINTPELELSTILLKSSSIAMEAVVMEIKALRTSQDGDSLRYNASSYKVSGDADVEGLLQKMPGISIEDGTVTAQGETVTNIYIDGREFFGGDVATALKSLPAEVVDKIEVFNKLSDEAEYTGMDDGSGSKTINIVTKPEMREGIFGKLFGGVGYEPMPKENASEVKYMGGGSINIFKGKSRISVITLLNNLNQQNFSFEDIMGATEEGSSTGEFTVKALPGVANVNAVGVNYSSVAGKDDKVKIQGSYFYNQTETDNTEQITRWYEEPATETTDSLYQTTKSNTTNVNNRLTGRIDVKINDRQSLMIRPTFSYQSTDPFTIKAGTRYDDVNYGDAGIQTYGNTKNSYWDGYNAGLSANYRLRLNDKGRSVSLSASATSNSYETDSETATEPNSTSTDTDTTYTFENTPTTKSTQSSSVNYMEPLTEKLRLNLTYKFGHTYQKSDKRTFETEDDFFVADFDEVKTQTYAESDYITHNAGVGLRYSQGKSRVTATVYYQNAIFDVNTIRNKSSNGSSNIVDTSKDYNNLTYSVVAKLPINSSNSLRLYLNGYNSTPPIWKFTDNTTSTSYVTAGNSDLEPTYTNRVRLYYTRTSVEKGSTLMFNCNALMTKNYISSHIVLDPGEIAIDEETIYDDVQQYTGWVNLDSYYKLDSNLSYGMPLDFIKCNLNLNGGISYTSTPSIYGGEVIEMGVVDGGELIETESVTYRAGATLGSNISDRVDFTLSWRGNYSDASNAYAGTTTENLYFNQSATAYMKFVLFGGLTLTSNISYKQYLGITNNYNNSYVLFNAFVGHKVMRNDRGEITFGVNDILDQNTSISQSVSTNYTQNKTNTTIGRYFSVQFIYNLRAFGIFGKSSSK
ncbi:MAG: outer membrane beta-barrel protein [Rikenellaceae bacterium]